MMKFFRRYQKVVFIVISAVTIGSFSFFGTFGAIAPDRSGSDREVGQTIDGSKITEREVEGAIRFFSTLGEKFFAEEILSSGLAALVVEREFAGLSEELLPRLERARRFRPYMHPAEGRISAEEVWRRMFPQIVHDFRRFREVESSPEAFTLYSKLFVDQLAFPPELMGRILAYQQQQMPGIPHDPALDLRRLSLFGHHSLEEWFGKPLLTRLVHLCRDLSVIAQRRGEAVSRKFAHADLVQMIVQRVKEEQNHDVSYAEASQLIHRQAAAVGMDEGSFVEMWRSLLPVKRLLHHVGSSILVDPLVYQTIGGYAAETATLELYQLPEQLRLKNFWAMLELQFYLDAVASRQARALKDLPDHFLSPDEVEKKCPGLVITPFALNVKMVHRDEIALQRVPLKEVWEWEVTDSGWTALADTFPMVNTKSPKTAAERAEVLEGIDRALRVKIDRFARSAITLAHPEWSQEALDRADDKEFEIALRSAGATAPFDEVKEPAELLKALAQAAPGEPFVYSHEETDYQVTLLERNEGKRVMTFEEATRGGVITQLLTETLEAAYPDVSRKDPKTYQRKDGGWKSFSEVRDQVGRYVYADLLRTLSPMPLGLDAYAPLRLRTYMDERRAGIAQGALKVPVGDSLCDQWNLIQATKTVHRSSPQGLPRAMIFDGLVGAWSATVHRGGGDLAFFRILEKRKEEGPVEEKGQEGQKLLATDLQRRYLAQLLAEVEAARS
jgi:hypothetical protein